MIVTIFIETAVAGEAKAKYNERHREPGPSGADQQLGATSDAHVFQNPTFGMRRHGGEAGGSGSAGGVEVEMVDRSASADPTAIEINMDMVAFPNASSVEGNGPMLNPILAAAASGQSSGEFVAKSQFAAWL